MGAMGACVWEMAGFPTIVRPVGALLLAVCMVGVCIGKRTVQQWTRALIEVYGYSFLFAGIIPYVSKMIPVWSGTVLVSYGGIKLWLWWQERRENREVWVVFEMESMRKRLRAIVDTGHCLREPITGKPVVVLRKECLPETVKPNWPLCYESVQGKGILWGFWPKQVWIGDQLYREKEILVAVASEWKETNWDALLPGYLMK